MSRPRILAIAYACMPGVGSEPGTGFAWARMLGGIGETWILTRPWPARQAELDAAIAASPEAEHLHVEYVRLPRWLRRTDWDPFGKGNKRFEYIVWQLMAIRTARRLARTEHLDLVWHLTYANVWMGSVGALVGPRFVLGPVGGGVGSPWRLTVGQGVRGLAPEVLRSTVRTLARYLNPLARVAWRRATLILATNRETVRWLPASARGRTEVFHHVALEDDFAARTRHRAAGSPPVALFAGRLIHWKGVGLAIRAIAALPGWRLIVAGSGPQERRLRSLAAKLGVAGRVDFRGWLPRETVLRVMGEEADVMIFPSLHEEGGWAVGEAIAAGLPVVCLNRGGPPLVGGRPITVADEQETVRRLTRAAEEAIADPSPLPVPPLLEERRHALEVILRRRGIV